MAGWLVVKLTRWLAGWLLGWKFSFVAIAIAVVIVIVIVLLYSFVGCCFVAAKQKHLWNVKTWFPWLYSHSKMFKRNRTEPKRSALCRLLFSFFSSCCSFLFGSFIFLLLLLFLVSISMYMLYVLYFILSWASEWISTVSEWLWVFVCVCVCVWFFSFLFRLIGRSSIIFLFHFVHIVIVIVVIVLIVKSCCRFSKKLLIFLLFLLMLLLL